MAKHLILIVVTLLVRCMPLLAQVCRASLCSAAYLCRSLTKLSFEAQVPHSGASMQGKPLQRSVLPAKRDK